jgi:hypothetical protein
VRHRKLDAPYELQATGSRSVFSLVLFLIFVVPLPPSSPCSIPTGELTPMATAAQIEANRLALIDE